MTKKKRKKKERGRLPSQLASEIGLRCRLYRQGTKTPCLNPATCFLAGVGDMCDSHPQTKGAIRYATERAAAVKEAA